MGRATTKAATTASTSPAVTSHRARPNLSFSGLRWGRLFLFAARFGVPAVGALCPGVGRWPGGIGLRSGLGGRPGRITL
jgi:hypothetical protein